MSTRDDAGKDAPDVALTARTSLLTIRAFDSYWSENVQRRRLPFDPELVRHIHGLYEWWMRTYGARFPEDDPDVLQVRGILSFGVDDLIRAVGQVERGEVVPLDEVLDSITPSD